MINLKNKNIIVTGASGGIGNSIVKKLSEFEANILATGTKTEKLEELKLNVKNVKILTFDISQSEKIEEFIENATTQLGGKLDCIVNNAGLTQDNLAIRMSLDEWRKVIDINLTSTFLLSKFAIKKMLKNKSGKIVNITSVVGHTGNLGQANYTASKAGIVAMSKSLAIEYAKKNINVNCISPGFIKTAMTDKLDQKFKELIISKILPVLDDFNRANTEMNKKDGVLDKEGIKLIYNKFNEVLKSNGLNQTEVKIGDLFDAEIHEAITQIPASKEKDKGKIIDIIEAGYQLGEKIIRYPKVVVGK